MVLVKPLDILHYLDYFAFVLLTMQTCYFCSYEQYTFFFFFVNQLVIGTFSPFHLDMFMFSWCLLCVCVCWRMHN